MKLKNPFQSATSRLLSKESENQLYAKAALDISEGIIDTGLWTKAFTKAEGDEKKQKAYYIELIIAHYRDLIEAGREIEEILNTKKKKEVREDEKKKQAKEKAEYYKRQSYKPYQPPPKKIISDEGLRYVVEVPKHTPEETRDVLLALSTILISIFIIAFLAA